MGQLFVRLKDDSQSGITDKVYIDCIRLDGIVEGTGKVIGVASANYRNSSGFIITGNEYYTLFDGKTGAALDNLISSIPMFTTL